ncbi:MAG TPA: DUF4082 domain-containing protein, partial [Arthrobacter sp.]
NYNLFPIAAPTGLQANEPDVTVNVGTSFYTTGPGWVTQIRYLQPSGGGTRWGAKIGAIWSIDGPTTYTKVAGPFTLPVAVDENSWVTYTLPTPFALTTGQLYRVAVLYPQGGYPATGAYFAGTTDLVQGILTVPAAGNVANAMQGTYKYTPYPEDCPDSAFNAGSYYADATVTDINPFNVTPAGIASATAFGTAAVSGLLTVTPSGVGSGDAFGLASVSVNQTVAPAGLASGEAFGAAVVSVGAVTVSPSGLATGEAFGTASVYVAPPPINIVPGGIGSMLTFGAPALSTTLEIAPPGTPSAQAFGLLTIVSGAITAYPQGIAPISAMGTPEITLGELTVSPAGIPSAEAYGVTVIQGAIAGNFDFRVALLPRRYQASIVPNKP